MDMNSTQEPLYPRVSGQEDNFYDTMDGTAAEYDNAVNQQSTTDGATGGAQDMEKAMEEQWRKELTELEQEIATLRSVLSSKVTKANKLKQNLGITPIKEFQNDVKQGIRNIKGSDTYQKTSDKMTEIGDAITHTEAFQKTNAALKSFGDWSSKKLGDVRGSNAFRSFEEKCGEAYSSVKHSQSMGNIKGRLTKISSSKSQDDFDHALRSSVAEEKIPEEQSAPEKRPL